MSQIAFGFDHASLLDILERSTTCEKIVMSLCNLKRPSTGKTSMHIAAHFCDNLGNPIERTVFEVACPYPPGWSLEDHDPGNEPPGGRYLVNFDELKGSPKFSISRDNLLNVLRSNSFPETNGAARKQLLATVEATNGSEPLRTFIRFITNPGDLARMTDNVAVTFEG